MCVYICGRSNTLTAEDPTGTYYTQNAHKTSSPGRERDILASTNENKKKGEAMRRNVCLLSR
jgi:hypothetical protein